jgi:hypothetical protein
LKVKSRFGIVDQVKWVHKDKNGKVIKRYDSNSWQNRLLRMLHLKRHECIVAVGMANVSGLLLTDVGGTAYDYMAIGTGVVAADVADTALGTQQGVRQLTTGTQETTDETDDTAQWIATFSQAIDATLTGTDAITEIGIFYDAEGVTVSMLMRQTFAAESMDWDAGDSIEFTVKVQVVQGA